MRESYISIKKKVKKFNDADWPLMKEHRLIEKIILLIEKEIEKMKKYNKSQLGLK